ncbi:E1B large T-antigen [Bat mastadenovirus G]|uniref:E1B 55 kDa protein n=1 Tax=Bat mastadenovirus G TaxID=2015376 RepID=A0A1J0FAP6_9ADEN|nr:E1B large T-antigen [Bat mastadenovirus G]APC26055.1 E1B large T-antigen [Bat mastadenovirus G]
MEPNYEADGRAAAVGNGGRAGSGGGQRGSGRRDQRDHPAAAVNQHPNGAAGNGLVENVFFVLDPLHVLPMINPDHYVVSGDQVEFAAIREDERLNGPSDRWNYSSVKTVRVNPGDDLEAAIRLHAKISLQPGGVYELNRNIRVVGACYIIGNCAVLKVNLPQGGPLFTVSHSEPIPAIGFMERVCFSNLVFESVGSSKAICCVSNRNILFHGCIFSGAHMLCLDMRAGAEVRGCQFFGAVCAVRSRGLYSMRVKNCSFERCVFGVVAETKVNINRCFFGDCTCSIKLSTVGSVTNSQVIVTNRHQSPMNVQLCTCEDGGHVQALGNVHIGSHCEAPWPKFEGNTLNRVRMYMGRRRGVFHPRHCLFGLSVIAAPTGVAQQVYLYSVYDTTCGIMQLSTYEGDAGERLCTCGERHSTPCMRASYVTDSRVNRDLNSHDTAEFSSSDEDEEF